MGLHVLSDQRLKRVAQALVIHRLWRGRRRIMNKPLRKSVLCTTAAALMMGSAWAHEPGRMTGGGSFVCSGIYSGTQKVTHGFELHCLDDPPATLAEPNNLEINFS